MHFFETNSDIFLIAIAILSLFIGSFLNVVIYRLPRMMQQNWSEECRVYLGLKPHTEVEKLNLYLPFSHCPACKKTIRPWHNIPLFSYLWLRGKCAYCKASPPLPCCSRSPPARLSVPASASLEQWCQPPSTSPAM